MIKHYLKIAVRQLMKYKVQNLIAVLGLGLALLCFSVCLYISRFINATDDCFERRNEIAHVTLQRMESGRDIAGVPTELAFKLKNEGMDFPTCLVAYPREREYNVDVGAEKFLPYTLNCMEVDTTYCQFFTPQITEGTWLQATHAQNAIILSESMATRVFGMPEKALGKHLVLGHRLYTSPQSTPKEGGITYTVQAVMKDLPSNTSFDFLGRIHALIVNDSEGRLQNGVRPGVTGCWLFVMPGKKSISQCNREIETREMTYLLWDEEMSILFHSLGEVFWRQSVASYFSNVTLIAGSLVLLVSLLNFFYFLIGSFLTRIREFNIRRVNGAGFSQQFFLLFTQSAVAIVIAAFFTFLLIELLAPGLHMDLFQYSLTVDPTVLLGQTFTYLIYLLLICALLTTFMVVKFRKVNFQSGLSGGTNRYGKHRIRNILLGVQLFIGIVFITFSVALFLQSELSARTMFGTLTIEEKENVFSVSLDYSFLSQQQRNEMVGRIKQQSGVEDVILADIAYTKGVSGTGLQTEKGNPDSYMEALTFRVTPNFFSFMNVQMETGKTPALYEAAIDRELERKLKKNILGMTLYDTNDRGYTVQGICNDFNCSNLSANGFLFIVDDFADYFGHCYVKCSPDKKTGVRSSIEKVLRDYIPESAELRICTLMDEIVQSQAFEFELRGIILYMGVVTLMISLLGIYSAITLDTEHRQKEMAIRKINGAKVRDIALLFARLYITLVVITSAFAFLLVGVILGVIKRMYNSFIDTGIFFYGSIFVGVVLLITMLVYLRIWKISRINPAAIIKNE